MQREPLIHHQVIAGGYGLKKGVEESISKCEYVMYIGCVVVKVYDTSREGGMGKMSIVEAKYREQSIPLQNRTHHRSSLRQLHHC